MQILASGLEIQSIKVKDSILDMTLLKTLTMNSQTLTLKINKFLKDKSTFLKLVMIQDLKWNR